MSFFASQAEAGGCGLIVNLESLDEVIGVFETAVLCVAASLGSFIMAIRQVSIEQQLKYQKADMKTIVIVKDI